ncbi:aminotransferase [Fusarium avenaceum]|nr:aminotransferase [Fusarium avenaceum]
MATMDKVFAGYDKRQATLGDSDNKFAHGIAWVKGELVPLHEARIPLLDEGFMHGDLTYDVPSVWDGRFFRLDDHLDRIEASCKKMRLQFPISRDKIKKTLIEMVAKSEIRDAFVELIVTRGLKGVRGHRPDELLNNNLYMFVQPFVWVMKPDDQYQGGRAIVARTVRRTPPGSFDPTIKNLQWGDLTRGLFEANDRGATYPFLTDGDTNLTEGSGFNIVLIKDGVLYTPDRGVLEGITRKSVIDAAKSCGYETRVENVLIEATYEADEIFMCTTAGGIMPITTLDDKPVADGKVGPITNKIWDRYWAMHWEDEFSFKIDY